MTLYDQVIASLSAEDFDSFIPLLGSGMLFSLDESDLFSLVIDPELNLLKMIILTIQDYEQELTAYNKNYFFNIDAFLTFRLYRYSLQDLREPVIEIMKDSRILDFSLLITYHLIRSIDYETFIALCEESSIFKHFFEYLLDDYKEDEEWQNYGTPPHSPYYENLGFHLTLPLKRQLITLLTEDDLEFVLLLYTLEWFQFFTITQLNEIQDIIARRIGEVPTLKRVKINNVLRSLDGRVKAYERGIIKTQVTEPKEYVIINGIKYFAHDNTLILRDLGITDIDEIEGLERLTNLEKLDLSNNQIKVIKRLDSLVNLRTLSMRVNQIEKIQGLEKLTLLHDLNLYFNKITEITGLETLELLGRLNLGNNKLTEIKGLESLKYLEELYLYMNHISEITGLDTLTNLQVLNIHENNISEIQGLSSLRHLKWLLLVDNEITEIKGLDGLVDLRRLLLGNNKITELKGLEGLNWLKELRLKGNPIPKALIEELGGTTEYGGVYEPQNFIDYCREHYNKSPKQ